VAFGILAAVAGAWKLISYFRTKPEEAMQKRDLANGLMLLILGLFCAFRSQWLIVTFPVITVLYGVATLVLGLCSHLPTYQYARQERSETAPIVLLKSFLIILFP
jgi:uncharacterized membrane protein HdeD (DUF308 family)